MAPGTPELKAFLLETPFFGGLSNASLDVLIPMMVERRIAAGQAVVTEGEPGRSMFVVHAGVLAVLLRSEGGEAIRLNTLGPGDFFGEMTLIEMQNRSATVVVEKDAVLFELTARNLYDFYKRDVHAYVMVLQNMNRELSRRLRRADGRVVRSRAGSDAGTTSDGTEGRRR